MSARRMLMNPTLQDKPGDFPKTQVRGAPLKAMIQVLLDRRATSHFAPDPVPDEYLDTILRFATQAPSGYNLQPWRFIVVRDPENRKRLQKVAMDQPKVGEAPVVVIAFGIKGEWKSTMDAIIREGARRGVGKMENVEATKNNISQFLGSFPAAVWLNRHTMIALTTMMLVAEAYGLDTAPMEGFDPEGVKREFGLPAEAEVIALLAIGFGKEPEKPYGGRLALENFVHAEYYGRRWKGK